MTTSARSPVRAELGRALRVPFSSLLEGLRLGVRTHSGVVHVDEPSVCPVLRGLAPCPDERLVPAWRGASRPSVGTPVTMALPDLVGAEVCTSCGRRILMPRGSVAPELDAALSYASQAHLLERLERPAAGLSAAALQRRRSEAVDLERSLRLLRARHGSTSELGRAVGSASDVLLERLGTARAALDAALATDAAREGLLAWVRSACVPSQYAGVDFALDESPTLVGIYPYQARWVTQRVQALVDAFSLRTGPVTVLVVPRFVYDYLQRTDLGKLSRSSLLLGVDAQRDAAVLETAAALWDPGTPGPAASLVGALQAAELLV